MPPTMAALARHSVWQRRVKGSAGPRLRLRQQPRPPLNQVESSLSPVARGLGSILLVRLTGERPRTGGSYPGQLLDITE